MDASHIFARGVLAATPLMGGLLGVVVPRACAGCWAGLPLGSVAVTTLPGWGLLPSCWGRSPEGWV